MQPLRMLLPASSALIVVDMQQGFSTLCPAELPVPGGLEIVPAVNELLALNWARIDATQDWHPADHCSFLGQRDNIYPPHCVMSTPGAEFLPGLHTHRFHTICARVSTGIEKHMRSLPNSPRLCRRCERRVWSVRSFVGSPPISAASPQRDLRKAGFQVWMVEDACAGIDVPTAGLFQTEAKAEGIAIGIRYASLAEVKSSMR